MSTIVPLLVCLTFVSALASGVPPAQRIVMGTFSPYYSPAVAQVPNGISISWENPTATIHSITHDGCKAGERCAFDSGPVGPSQTFLLEELSPGMYPYHCTFHPIMRGLLVVHESDPTIKL
ncbi:MAG: hypothetical protein MRJ96_06155 [Nitrospirales bacterium]|nr:hypothetical protein [Nitrospira sp.]MDR4501018.1 hypothetical protein [Nitrospirales bacterium]